MNSLVKCAFSMLLLFFGYFDLRAQELEDEKRSIIEQRVDFLLDVNEGGNADFTTLFEQLQFYYDRPINLNRTSQAELENLGLLNSIQINNLLEHIEKNDNLITFEELQTIEGFNLEDIRLIQPFTKVGGDLDQARLNFKTLLKEGQAQYFLRYSRILEEQEGFKPIDAKELAENPNARYLGNADRIFNRFRFQYANKLSLGFTAEKDPGEEFFKGSQKNGFDFYSAHIFAQDIGIVKQVVLGDFQAQFGQGLTFWSGLAFGRTPSVFSLKRNAPKLRPYSSVQEDLFLRGGGITLTKFNFDLTLFYSSQGVDGNEDGRDSLTNELIVTSLPQDGFHRTPTELEGKNNVMNRFFGGHLSYSKRNFSLGLTAVQNEIDADFRPRIQLRNQFSALDESNTNYGLDFNYLYKNLNLFGEASSSIDGGNAYTVGALVVIDPRLSIGIQQRNFDRDFKPIQSNAIGEGSVNSNEQGTFFGIEAKISDHINLSTYADRFAFKWLRFQTDAPSQGYRYFSQLTYKPSRQLESYFRYRRRNRGGNMPGTAEGIDNVVEEVQDNYRLNFSYQITSTIKISSRIEYTNYRLGEASREEGILAYQDIHYKKLSFPLSFSLRYAIFETDSYNSRIYAYENDVLYAFSIPAYNGRGSRFYVLTKYRIRRGVDLWIRYAQTYLSDRNTIGSGKELIDTNRRSDIKLQLRIKF